jgi:hypothetical protein
VAAGHEAHSVVEQSLGGQSDERVIEVCVHERRTLVTLDLDFPIFWPTHRLSSPGLWSSVSTIKRMPTLKGPSLGCWGRCRESLLKTSFGSWTSAESESTTKIGKRLAYNILRKIPSRRTKW